jgi:hypothetical protein
LKQREEGIAKEIRNMLNGVCWDGLVYLGYSVLGIQCGGNKKACRNTVRKVLRKNVEKFSTVYVRAG